MRLRLTIAALLLAVLDTAAQFREPLMPRPPAFGRFASLAVRLDTWIPVGADSLEAACYVPSMPPPDTAGYPAMIFVHGFGGSKDWDTASASLWAGSGYVALCYSVRGHGNSSGETSIMGPPERADLPAVVAFVRSLPIVNPARIGLQGGSQGGLHGLWAKIDALPVHAVSADVISPLWASTLLSNGTIRRTFTMLLRATGVRWFAERDTLWDLVRTDRYDLLRDRFVPGRDLDTSRLHASTVPLLSFLKWGDHYFSASDGITSFLGQRPPTRIYLGTGGHYSDDNLAELTYQWDLIARWFNEILEGDSTGVLDEPPITYAVSSFPVTGTGGFTWTREVSTTWPPAGVAPLRLYFAPESLLVFEMPATRDSVPVGNQWDPAYTFDNALEDEFAGPRFDAAFPRDTRVFVTPPLSEELLWAGIPRLHLSVRPGSAVFPLHARIFEEDAGGTSAFINRINFCGRGWTAGAVDSITVDGLAHAHRFARGSRIRVELTNLDVSHAEEWGGAPFVLPVFHREETTVFLGGADGSWIELPAAAGPGAFTGIIWFSASVESTERVVLRWRSVAEAGTVGYDVEERTHPGGQWSVLTTRPAAGAGTYQVIDSTSAGAQRWYRLVQVNTAGRIVYPETLFVDMSVTSVAYTGAREFVLEQNYPNPFNPTTTLVFSLPSRARVLLAIYNILGEEVARPVDGSLDAGVFSVTWDASRKPAGVYFARLSSAGASVTRPMLLLR